MNKFRVGDKVTRPKDVYKTKSPLMHGIIIKVYSKSTKFGIYPELYTVKWDNNDITTRSSYLPHGLDHDT